MTFYACHLFHASDFVELIFCICMYVCCLIARYIKTPVILIDTHKLSLNLANNYNNNKRKYDIAINSTTIQVQLRER